MPITCPIQFEPLSTEAFGPLDYAVMEHAFASHQYLGSLADEQVYQLDFADRLRNAGYKIQREVPVTVKFDTFIKLHFLDLVVNDKAVYELKTVESLTKRHSAQLLNYLLLLDLQRGKLINFRPMSLESRFVNAPLSGADRRRFAVTEVQWHGPRVLLDLVQEILKDWGTGLELGLYEQAITHLLGGEGEVSLNLPMSRDGTMIGNQRFHLATSDSAVQLTAFTKTPSGYPSQLMRLLRASPLNAIHWINMDYHQVTFNSILK